MDAPSLVIAALVAIVALAPAAVAVVTGRRLLRRTGDPAFPELLQARGSLIVKVAAVAVAVLLLLGRGHGWWAIPLLLAGLLAGGFPLRRAIWEERWGLGAYLWANVCIVSAFAGPWLLAALAPAVVLGASAMGPTSAAVAASVLAATIVGWTLRYRQAWIALTRATPLDDAALAERFAAVDARARVAPPLRFRFGHAGSALMNAVALPDPRRHAVAFTGPLLDRLSAAEITAIYAHEVAHLEHFDGRRIRLLRLVGVALALLSPGLGLYVALRSPWLAAWFPWLWVIVVLLAIGRRAAISRGHETASDLRAVELTGDGEALVRGLVALHEHARLPRRWAHDIEQAATHPSLARRVQAIRAAAADGAGPVAPVLASPVVLRSADAGAWVAFDAERAHWGSGAPDGVASELSVLRERSSSYRAAAYAELAELRVDARGDRHLLRATDRAGDSWSTPLHADDVAVVQRLLDLVDAKLGERAPARAGALPAQLAAGLLLLALIVAGQFGAAVLPAALAVFVPGAAALAAAGAMALARAGIAIGDVQFLWGGPYATVALLLATLLGAVCAWFAWRRRGESTKHGARPAVALLLVIAAFQVGTIISVRDVGLPGLALPSLASLGITALGLGAALAVSPSRGRRRFGLALGGAAVVGAVWAAGAERLTSDGAAVAWERAAATPVARAEVGPAARLLRVSPGGARFAVAVSAEYEDEGDEDLADATAVAAPVFAIGDFAGARRTLRARDVAFLDDERLLVLARRDTVLELRLEPATGGAALRRDALPALAAPALLVDRSSGAWAVTGRDPTTGDLVRVAGRVDSSGVDVRRWPAAASGYFAPLVFEGGRSLVVTRGVRQESVALPFVATGAAAFRYDLWRVDSGGGERRLGRVAGLPLCVQPRADSAGFCLAQEGLRSTLWRVSDGALERVTRLPMMVGGASTSNGRWLASSFGEPGFVVIDLAARRGLRVALPDSASAQEVVEVPSGAVVLSQRWDGGRGTSSIVRYAVPQAAGRAPSRAEATEPGQPE